MPPASRAGPSSTTPRRSTASRRVAREMAVSVDHPTLGRVRTIGTPLKLSATPLDAGAGRRNWASTPMRCCASSAVRPTRWPHCARTVRSAERSRPLSSEHAVLARSLLPLLLRVASDRRRTALHAARRAEALRRARRHPDAAHVADGPGRGHRDLRRAGHRCGSLHLADCVRWPAGRWPSPTSRHTCHAGSGRFRTAASSPSSTASSSSTSPRAGRGNGACDSRRGGAPRQVRGYFPCALISRICRMCRCECVEIIRNH